LNESGLEGQRPTIRCRVTLKARVILDAAGERPLDGDAFGRLSDEVDPETGMRRTDLIFESGDGLPGGDFESWFYLGERD
jgi:hypothetical protein